MITTRLDTIVRNVLLRKHYPLQYYLDGLLASVNCLRSLTFDDLKIVNTKRLVVDGSNCVAVDGNVADIVSIYNCHGYRYSRLAGDRYKINIANNEIEFHENYCGHDVVISYIDDGRNADAATHVHVYAEETIEAYIFWQLAEMSRSYSMGEKMMLKAEYMREREILRARMSDLDLGTLRRIANRGRIRRAYFPSIAANVTAPATNTYVTTIQPPDVITLPQGADNYTVPAGSLIEKVLVLNALGYSVGIGNTQGGYELAEAMEIIDDEALFHIDTYYPIQASIWFTGVPPLSTIKIYKR